MPYVCLTTLAAAHLPLRLPVPCEAIRACLALLWRFHVAALWRWACKARPGLPILQETAQHGIAAQGIRLAGSASSCNARCVTQWRRSGEAQAHCLLTHHCTAGQPQWAGLPRQESGRAAAPGQPVHSPTVACTPPLSPDCAAARHRALSEEACAVSAQQALRQCPVRCSEIRLRSACWSPSTPQDSAGAPAVQLEQQTFSTWRCPACTLTQEEGRCQG